MLGLCLLIDDEVDLTTTLEYNLIRAGYQIRVALTGVAGLAGALDHPTPDVIVLDVMLPDLPGTEVCRRLREHERTCDIPIVMCSARGSERDRTLGFEVGADDYVLKPYSVRELLLRIHALLPWGPQSDPEPASSRVGRLRLDRATRRSWVDDREVALTALEHRLLDTLLSRPGEVQTRDTLLSDVWGLDDDTVRGLGDGALAQTVDTHVKRLRDKLGDSGRSIATVPGGGYRFLDEVT